MAGTCRELHWAQLKNGWMKQMKDIEEKYTLPIVKHVGKFAKKLAATVEWILSWTGV